MKKGSLIKRALAVETTGYARNLILIRLPVGLVFLSEGIQKFLFTDALGVGRFIKIGIPAPEIMAPFVGLIEILCGALILLGLASRIAAIPLVVDMLVALASTKIPLLIHEGFWKMAHESRVDFTMLCALLFLLSTGSGTWSFDRWIGPSDQARIPTE